MLTASQISAIQANIAANADLNTLPATNAGTMTMTNMYNALASPAFIVWRTSVPVSDIQSGAAWDWTRVDNLSVGKARAWEWMTANGMLNAAQANIRAGIDAVWVGTAADLAVRASVYTFCKRSATRLEKVLATGTGSDAVPATLTFEGQITLDDMAIVRGL